MSATLEQARACKAHVQERLEGVEGVTGIGITRVGKAYAVKVNLSHEVKEVRAMLPATERGVKIVVDVVGVVRKRGA